MAFTAEQILEEFVEAGRHPMQERLSGFLTFRLNKERKRQLEKYHRLYRTPERLEARARYMREHRRKKRGLK